MLTIVLTARALGVSNFGLLVGLLAYITIVDRLVNFQSWLALIKFGADHQLHNRRQQLEDIFKLGLCIDLGTAIIGAAIAAIAAPLVGWLLSWDKELITYAILYSVVIAFNIEGAAIAILRLNDQFKLLGMHKVFGATVKLVLTVIAFLTTDSMAVFIAIAALSQLASHLLLLALAFREFRQMGLAPVRRGRAKQALKENKGISLYVITTNLHASFRMLPDQLDVLIIAAMLGNAATGTYKIAKDLARVLSHLVQPLYQAIYPELARLSAERKWVEMRQFMTRSSVLAGFLAVAIWVITILIGRDVLYHLFGTDYVDAYPVLIWYMGGVVIGATSFAITPAALALGLPRLSLAAIAISSVAYLLMLPFLLSRLGLIGAGVAFVLFYVTWCISMGLGAALQLSRGSRSGSQRA